MAPPVQMSLQQAQQQQQAQQAQQQQQQQQQQHPLLMQDSPHSPADSLSGPSSSGAGGAPAGYGRSCTNCSRAKCKCILRTADGPCERCHRLGKDCRPIEASRKRIVKKPSSSQTAQLEQKLDDLVSILRASNHPSLANVLPPDQVNAFSPGTLAGLPSRLDSLATAATASSSSNGNGHVTAVAYQTNLNAHPSFNPNNPNSNTNIHHPQNNSNIASPANVHHAAPSAAAVNASVIHPALAGGPVRPEPTPVEAENYLDKFRSWLRNFPFMHIGPDVAASDLRRERPFLWLCIMNITSMSIPQMQAIKERVRMELAQRIFIDHEPSMDLLLGIIVCLAWSTNNSFPGSKPFLILFTQTATSVLYELGLSRSPLEEQYFAASFKGATSKGSQPRMRTAEERRALVALWYLTSVTSSFIGKIDTMRWSPHMQETLEALEREKEGPGDGVLAAMVRLQLLGDEAHKLLLRDVASAGAVAMGGEPTNETPSYVFRKNMVQRLQALKDKISPDAAANYVVQSHYHIAEVLIQFIGVFVPGVPDLSRIDSMYSCLRAVRSWYDIWFSIPLIDIPGLPFSIYTQLSQTQVALHRLTTTDDPAWDKELLRNTADLLVILDRSAVRFEEVERVYPQEPGEDCQTIWSKAVKILRNIKTTWEPTLSQCLNREPSGSGGNDAPDVHGSVGHGTGGQGHGGMVGGMPTPTSQGVAVNVGAARAPHQGQEMVMDGTNAGSVLTEPVDFNDLAWMTDVFGPWEF